jgi:hypothetical protein
MTDELTPPHYELLLELLHAAAFDGILLIDPVLYDLIGWRSLIWIEQQGHARDLMKPLIEGGLVKLRVFGGTQPMEMWRITMRGINEAKTLTVKRDML